MLKIYDIIRNKKISILNNKEEGEKDKKIRIFLCGPTSYQDIHFGHARFFFVFDLISRILNFHNIQTTIVINITDLDPKIFSKARDNKIEELNLYVEQNIHEFLELSKKLNFKDGMIFAKVSNEEIYQRNFKMRLQIKDLIYPFAKKIQMIFSYGIALIH